MIRIKCNIQDHLKRGEQTKMGEDLDIPYPTISMICNGRQIPKVSLAIRIANYLGCRVEDLWDIE